MADLEPIGVYPCNPDLGLVLEARLGNGQLGTIILVKPAGQVTDEVLVKDLGPALGFVDRVLDVRATSIKGSTPSPTAILRIDVYQRLPGNPARVGLRSYEDSKTFGDNGLARLMVSVMVV